MRAFRCILKREVQLPGNAEPFGDPANRKRLSTFWLIAIGLLFGINIENEGEDAKSCLTFLSMHMNSCTFTEKTACFHPVHSLHSDGF